MDLYLKSFATFRTLARYTALSWALVTDSLDYETSTVTISGTDLGIDQAGNWAVINDLIYGILTVKPQTDRTLLTLVSPLDLISRRLYPPEQSEGQTVGGFLADAVTDNYIEATDTVYAIPYIVVSNLDTTSYVPPEVDNTGCYALADYARLMRKTYGVTMRWTFDRENIYLSISLPAKQQHNVLFDGGIAQLMQADFSSSGTAKITAVLYVDTGEVDENGEKIQQRTTSDWYLGEDGEVYASPPARRASGNWSVLAVNDKTPIRDQVAASFAKNKSNHKIEFWSGRAYAVGDDATFRVYGQVLRSAISYARVTSEDSRTYYKSGELAVTAAEKLKAR